MIVCPVNAAAAAYAVVVVTDDAAMTSLTIACCWLLLFRHAVLLAVLLLITSSCAGRRGLFFSRLNLIVAEQTAIRPYIHHDRLFQNHDENRLETKTSSTLCMH